MTPPRYDPAEDRWKPVAAGTSASTGASPGVATPVEALTVVTFNVWFSSYCLLERCTALLDVVRARRPDVIALQEVLPVFLERLLAQAWIRADYAVSDADGATLGPYGVLLLSRLPVHLMCLHPLPSRMARHLLCARIDTGAGPLEVATVHLESKRANGPTRAAQLETVFGLLEASPQAVLMGDFNFHADDPAPRERIDARFRDAWSALRPDDPGFTEDTDLNAMRLRAKGKAKRARYDRVLLRSDDGLWEAATIELIGRRPIGSAALPVFPSDHFGLVATLRRAAW